MGTAKTDLRVVRTKKNIREVLIDLLEKRSFGAITIRDITEQAQINRTTFYRHYEDKYDLLEKVISEILEDFEKTQDTSKMEG